MTKYEILERLEDDLRGECMQDCITKEEMTEYLKDAENWLYDTERKNGDIYCACGYEYKLTVKYVIAVWRDKEQRENGEPAYMTPICSETDLEAIKKECEAYDIESTGCIEISDEDEETWHYENGAWTKSE